MRSTSHPMTNPAIAVEMTMREREALMTMDDWSEQVDILLSQPPTERAPATSRDIEAPRQFGSYGHSDA